jgi:hypothetical protein
MYEINPIYTISASFVMESKKYPDANLEKNVVSRVD